VKEMYADFVVIRSGPASKKILVILLYAIFYAAGDVRGPALSFYKHGIRLIGGSKCF
jgi:hypothetical protein